MKKHLAKIAILLVLAIALPTFAACDVTFKAPQVEDSANNAENKPDNTLANGTPGLEFAYNEKNDNYSVYKYKGNSSEVIIPATYNGKAVVTISKTAFTGSNKVIVITIPDSIEKIEDDAFKNCKKLTNVVIGNAKSNLQGIGKHAFMGCTSLESITFFGDENTWDGITKGLNWDRDAGKDAANKTYQLIFKTVEITESETVTTAQTETIEISTAESISSTEVLDTETVAETETSAEIVTTQFETDPIHTEPHPEHTEPEHTKPQPPKPGQDQTDTERMTEIEDGTAETAINTEAFDTETVETETSPIQTESETYEPETVETETSPIQTESETYEPETEEESTEKHPEDNVEINLTFPAYGTIVKNHSPVDLIWNITTKDYRVHMGVDIVTSLGANVYAASDGFVTRIWDDASFGTCIEISHINDCYTYYKNLAPEIADGISEGDYVSCGQIIAYVGNTAVVEKDDDPHLHFELMLDDKVVDPLLYFITLPTPPTPDVAPDKCDHDDCKLVSARPATCYEDGREAHMICNICGTILSLDGIVLPTTPVIKSGHKLQYHEFLDSTCAEYGHDAYYTCIVCDVILNTDMEEIDELPLLEMAIGAFKYHVSLNWVDEMPSSCISTGHSAYVVCDYCNTYLDNDENIISGVPVTKINPDNHKIEYVPVKFPTTTEEGCFTPHYKCVDCGKCFDEDGNELDENEIEKIPVLNHAVEKYWGAYELSQMEVYGMQTSKFAAPEMSADRSYVRFARAGASNDGNVQFLNGNTDVTGQYLVIKYRTDHMSSGEIWANTTENSHSNGRSSSYVTYTTDGEWHIALFDLSETISSYIKPNDEGNYIIQWFRIDILNTAASEGYMDIAYIALCDDPADIASIIQEGDEELCPHIEAANSSYADCGDGNHVTNCLICGAELYSKHSCELLQWNDETKTYVGSCGLCCANAEQDMIYVSEPFYKTGYSRFIPEQMDGFVRYTCTGTTDPYIHIYAEGQAVTGEYAVIKYRLSNNGNNASIRNCYAGSVMGNHSMATNGCDQVSGITDRTLYGDGEWHYLIIKANSQCFVANPDGTYSYKFLRISGSDLAGDGSAYIDIAEIAFADNMDAVENYIFKNTPGNTEENPIIIEDPANTTVTVGAGKTVYLAGRVAGMIMTLNGNASVVHNGVTYEAVDGMVTIPECVGNMWMPSVFAITNIGEEEATYTITITYPVGSMENPEELIIGKSNNVNINEGSRGYYFTYTATHDGTLSMTVSISKANRVGWSICINNLTQGIYGDIEKQSGEILCQTKFEISVNCGDEIQIMVNTYDPYNEFVAPEGMVIFSTSMKADCQNHSLCTLTWNSESEMYEGYCICGEYVESNMLYKTESCTDSNAYSCQNFITVTSLTEGDETFVRYTPTKSVPDPYFFPYKNGTAVTGQYMIIKYRLENQGTNITASAPFASSAASGQTTAMGKSGDSSNIFVGGNTLYADGEWHYLIITPKLDSNLTFIANDDGTYTWAYLRFRLNTFAAFDGSCYMDIAEIAFADNIEATETYAYVNTGSTPPYMANLDNAICSIDGANDVTKSISANNAPIVIDLAGRTLSTPQSLMLGGWLCTPGGVESYNIRVTSIDGEAVEDPELVYWQTGATRGDIYSALGKNYGYSEACGNGAGINKAVIDLTGYEGKIINFEIVAITNYGAELVAVQVNNVTVPSAE